MLEYAYGAGAKQGGTDLILSLTPDEAHALGLDADVLADWFDTVLWALVHLRTGTPLDKQGWHVAINDLDHRLAPRLEGLRDALIRAHAKAGGSIGDLATSMDVAKSTAQYRRDVVLNSAPSVWEGWACGTLPGRDDPQ